MTDPTHIEDQLKAAVDESYSALHRLADALGTPAKYARSGDSPFVTMCYDRVGGPIDNGTYQGHVVCPHVNLQSPQPVAVCLAAADRVMCRECANHIDDVLHDDPMSPQFRKCDVCLKEITTDETLVALATYGPVTIIAQCCPDCVRERNPAMSDLWFGDIDPEDNDEAWWAADAELAASGMGEEERREFWRQMDPDTPVLDWHAELVAGGLSPEAARAYIEWFSKEMNGG